MKVLIFLVARWRRLRCSSRQRSRTLHGGEDRAAQGACPGRGVTIPEHRQPL